MRGRRAPAGRCRPSSRDAASLASGPGQLRTASPPPPRKNALQHVHFRAPASCSLAGDTVRSPRGAGERGAHGTGAPMTARPAAVPPQRCPRAPPPAPAEHTTNRLRLSRSERQLLLNFTDEQFLCFPSIFPTHTSERQVRPGVIGVTTKLLLHTNTSSPTHTLPALDERRRLPWTCG